MTLSARSTSRHLEWIYCNSYGCAGRSSTTHCMCELSNVAHQTAKEAALYAINRLNEALAKPRYRMVRGSLLYLQLRRDLPYVVHETTILGTQILLNRNYKPIGSSLREVFDRRVKYEDFPHLFVHLTLLQRLSVASPMTLANKAAWDSVKSDEEKSCWLFCDGDPPWMGRKESKAYLGRLESLSRLL